MIPVRAARLKKYYAVSIITGILGVQLWTIVPRGDNHQSWYWPFMNYPMYSVAHYPGDQFIRYELWAGPADLSDSLHFLPSRELHLTLFKYHTILKSAIGNDQSESTSNESASELIARIVAEHTSGNPQRLQIWEQSWTLGPAGINDRAGVRELKREWSPVCEFGPAVSRCTSDIP